MEFDEIDMVEFIECPNSDCKAIAEVLDRTSLESTSGPVEHVKTRCIHGHWYFGTSDQLLKRNEYY